MDIAAETIVQRGSGMFRFHHIHLGSPDPEATAEYYEKMFGAGITRSTYPAGSQYAGKPKLAMNLGGQRILIAPAHPSKPNVAPEAPYFGIEHIGLDVDDIDAVVAQLEAKEAEFTQKPAATATGNRNAFVRAPQGVLVEIIQLGAGRKQPG
jgi:lactoylglutathione lyase